MATGNIHCILLMYILLVGTVIAVEKIDSQKARTARVNMDPILKARCDATCLKEPKNNKTECRATCRRMARKAGSCGSGAGTWATACVDECARDEHCAGTARCCQHDCGAVCRQPEDLLTSPGLPAIPRDLIVIEERHAVRLLWQEVPHDGPVYYILEEQHHLGPKYEEERLGEWILLQITQRSNVTLKNIIKPGHWYRFRVSSVSALGTRGASPPSAAFTRRLGPRAPAAPRRLALRSVRAIGPQLSAELRWRPPRSDLPLTKYKVFWSRRLRGIDGALDSVLVNHQTVGKDQTYFELKDLQPNSMYFLQVQALSQFGGTKLRSNKAAIFLNTTHYTNDTRRETKNKKKTNSKIYDISVKKIFWTKSGLFAKINWHSDAKNIEILQRYIIQWWTEACGHDNKDVKCRKQLAATTELNNFELYELNFECKYTVQVNKLPSRKRASPDAILTFTTPSCEYFHLRTRSSKLQCNQET